MQAKAKQQSFLRTSPGWDNCVGASRPQQPGYGVYLPEVILEKKSPGSRMCSAGESAGSQGSAQGL